MDAKQKKILGAVAVFHVFNDASVVTLPTIFPILYTQGYLIKRYADIGTLILAGLAVAILFHFFVGHWAKGRHYRTLLFLDVLTVGLFLWLTPYARSFGMLILFYIGVRIGSSIYHPVGVSWVTNSFRGAIFDRAMGIQSAFGDVGVLAAFLGTGYLAQHYGWSVPLHVWGALCVAGAFAGLLLSRGTNGADDAGDESEPVSWSETIRDQRHFIVPAVVSGVAWGITMAYGPSLLNHRLGAPMSLTGIILGGWIAAGVVASLTYSRIAGHIGRDGVLILGFSVTAATTCLIGITTNLVLAAALIAIFGYALLLTFPALLTLVGASAKSRNRTAAFSLIANLQILGNAVFAFMAGFMSDAWGIHSPFIMLGALSLIVAIYAAALRTRMRRTAAAPPILEGIRP
jgi:MFS family permease